MLKYQGKSFVLGLCVLVAGLWGGGVLHAADREGVHTGKGAQEDSSAVEVVHIADEESVTTGEPFKRWMRKRGWRAEFGSPEYFYVRDGALHLVSKPGPVYKDRYSLAIFNRQKLINGMENKVLLRVAGGPEFRLNPRERPFVHFCMKPVSLPAEGADLRNPSKNDSAFYLLVGFDTERHEFEGRKMPETVAYVWANREWDAPVGRDPDYSAFLRYIPVGKGGESLGESREVVRNVRKDYRLAFPEKSGEPVPDVIRVGLMIDSNTVGGTAESVLEWVRFEEERPGQVEQGPEEGRE